MANQHRKFRLLFPTPPPSPTRLLTPGYHLPPNKILLISTLVGVVSILIVTGTLDLNAKVVGNLTKSLDMVLRELYGAVY
jgi:hypothetical protein